MKKLLSLLVIVTVLLCGVLSSCNSPEPSSGTIGDVPQFSDKAYVEINGNVPSFTDEEKSVTKSYEFYSELDSLGRCGYTMACIGTDLMPTEDRGSIGQVKPSGWQTVKYDIVDAKYLYNRCHLIGFQLTGENANVKNLITGTRYLNIEGMLPFENMVADYLKENPDNHVIYRCTPIFEGYNLVASGVHMEGYSVEDNGEGVCFNVYAYNAQPGVVIDYSNGMSRLATSEEWNGKLPSDKEDAKPEKPGDDDTFKLNTDTKKIHTLSCRYSENLTDNCKGDELGAYKAQGFSLCRTCDPIPDEIWEEITAYCLQCLDKDDDGKCDICALDFTDGCDAEHRDADDDGKCDIGGEDFTDGCDAKHRDADDDGKCDVGGEDFDDGKEIYALNTSSKKIHLLTCRYAENLTESCTAEDFALYKSIGFTLCGICKPITQDKWDSILPICTQHRDADDDNLCDMCESSYSDGCDVQVCRDADDDGKCDACKNSFFDGCDNEHKDENKDNVCDLCKESIKSESQDDFAEETSTYIINTESKKIHKSSCRHAKDPDGVKYKEFEGTEADLHDSYPEEDGYSACGTCKPYN